MSRVNKALESVSFLLVSSDEFIRPFLAKCGLKWTLIWSNNYVFNLKHANFTNLDINLG